VDAAHRGHDREVAAGAHDARLAEHGGVRRVRLGSFDRVRPLVLEEEHRVVVPDRRDQEQLGVRRRGRTDDLEPRDAEEPRHRHLRVDGAEAAAAADRRADHQRHGSLLVGQVPVLGRLVDEALGASR
jgi:hypothetical protein